jgi:hypothetical protein
MCREYDLKTDRQYDLYSWYACPKNHYSLAKQRFDVFDLERRYEGNRVCDL